MKLVELWKKPKKKGRETLEEIKEKGRSVTEKVKEKAHEAGLTKNPEDIGA